MHAIIGKCWKFYLFLLNIVCLYDIFDIPIHLMFVESLHNLQFSVHGTEYAFGAHDFPSSGVFEVEPRQCPGFRFRKSICIGTTHLNRKQVREFMEHQATNYSGDTYHLVVKNCNHFCEDICYKLTGNRIPKWVNRLAKIGMFIHILNHIQYLHI